MKNRKATVRIRELAEIVRAVVYPGAQVVFDSTKPDGSPRKLLDVTRLHALGWRHRMNLQDGIADAYRWFLEHQSTARGAGISEAPPTMPAGAGSAP